MTEIERYIPQSEEVHSRDIAEIRHDRLQIDDDHYRGEPEEAASDSELVDPTMYRQLIGSLMYLVNPTLVLQ